MPHERRHYVRVAFDAPALLTTGLGTFDVQVLDLSLQGALLALGAEPAAANLPAGAPCQLVIALSADNDHIAMTGDIVHIEGPHAGLQCRTMDLDSVTHLRRVIELQLGDPALLERDLAELIAAHAAQ
ncbi:PilZ domain-containing protein [Acidovorax sp. BLS4]|uniref:PilZ domain-containing protein n=1 Tax=Acidovorax sp. BLS4 TaxID=3273430 RepID=UPI0029421E49|nr:PilZ domain-containing protein [Paracidovorax avenae]WOI47341.1 PilZ domain-containing protein [Paracidovorax avenae]